MLLADEMSIRVDHRCGTTWGMVGRTPVVCAGAGRRSVRMFSAIGVDGTLRYRLSHEVMDRRAFLGFCAQLLRTVTGPIFLIVDGPSIHTAREAVTDEREFAAAMHRGMRRLQKRPGIVRAFFADPHLAYITP